MRLARVIPKSTFDIFIHIHFENTYDKTLSVYLYKYVPHTFKKIYMRKIKSYKKKNTKSSTENDNQTLTEKNITTNTYSAETPTSKEHKEKIRL